MLLIQDIMSRSPKTVEESAPVRKAKQIMSQHSVRHLPVIAAGKLFGIITDRDLKLAQAVADDKNFDDNRLVGDICVRNVYLVKGNEPAQNVLAYMAKEKIGSAVIIEANKLAGIFTVVDACKAFSQYLRDHEKSD